MEAPEHESIPFVVGTTGHIKAVVELDEAARDALRARIRDEIFVPLLTYDLPGSEPRSVVARACARVRRVAGRRARPRPTVRWKSGAAGDADVPAFGIPDTPLIILSGLAQGADRVLVQAAFEAAEQVGRPGAVQLVAVLAFDAEETRRTFPVADDGEFDELLDKAVVHVAPDMRSALGLEPSSSEGLSLQYGLQGMAIARWSRLLVSVWDGDEYAAVPDSAKGRGGTAHVIFAKRSGRIVNRSLHDAMRLLESAGDDLFGFAHETLDLPGVGPVISIDPAAGQPRLHDPIAYVAKPEKFRGYFREVVDRLSSANADLDSLHGELSNKRSGHRGKVVPEGGVEALTPHERSLRDLYAGVASIAGHYQSKSGTAYLTIYGIVAAAAFAFVMYSHGLAYPTKTAKFALVLYGIGIAAAGFVQLLAKARGLESRHWDMRALSEALRLQLAWGLAGISTSVAGRYLHRQRNELDWIRAALEARTISGPQRRTKYGPRLDSRTTTKAIEPGKASERMRLSLAKWTAGQYWYYRKESRKRGEKAIAAHFAGLGLIGASFAVTGIAVTKAGAYFKTPTWLIAAGILAVVVLVYFGLRDAHLRLRSKETGHVTLAAKCFGKWLFIGTAVASALAFGLPHLLQAVDQQWLQSTQHAWVVIGMGLPALAAALLHSYATRRAWEDEHEKFERMSHVYATAIRALCELAGTEAPAKDTTEKELVAHLEEIEPLLAPRREAAERVLRILGDESLAEHADWVLMHRARPVDLPHAM